MKGFDTGRKSIHLCPRNSYAQRTEPRPVRGFFVGETRQKSGVF